MEPLYTSHVYDDVECPALFKVEGRYYLLGSIREDVKVRYYYSNAFDGEYRAFHDNVLLPKGNYAARVTRDGDHLLVYCFYVAGENVFQSHRYLPPPKELKVDDKGRLMLTSFYRWEEKVARNFSSSPFRNVARCCAMRRHDNFGRPTVRYSSRAAVIRFGPFLTRVEIMFGRGV